VAPPLVPPPSFPISPTLLVLYYRFSLFEFGEKWNSCDEIKLIGLSIFWISGATGCIYRRRSQCEEGGGGGVAYNSVVWVRRRGVGERSEFIAEDWVVTSSIKLLAHAPCCKGYTARAAKAVVLQVSQRRQRACSQKHLGSFSLWSLLNDYMPT